MITEQKNIPSPCYTYLLQNEPNDENITDASIAGQRVFPKATTAPQCMHCAENLALFFQFTVQKHHHSRFKVGSLFLIYACLKHDDLPLEQYSDLDQTVQIGYQDKVHEHYAIMLISPDVEQDYFGDEDKLIYHPLYTHQIEEKLQYSDDFTKPFSTHYESKIAGQPAWINDEVDLNCTYGGKLQFLCQFAEGFEFFYGQGRTDYTHLFLGNQIYFFACDQQCSPYAVIAVCDN